ncbi:TPA: archease [Candidatus Bathyarchaeota archaeon]|nr:archease [Candidatus Bathyarchaeota archaeon]HIJ07859.1 archease [Candidatus Bathyarchaeota archaeon]
MEKTGKFEFLDHTADVLVAAHGNNLEEAFENAALAMFEIMTDTSKISPIVEDAVEVEAEDEYALLYSWLEALLVKFEVNGIVYSQFKVSSFEEMPDGFRLKANIWGEKFDPVKHPQKVGVKAITYHRMEIIKEFDKVTLEFILDI